MSEDIKNPEQQPTDSTPEASGGPGEERTFTQDEVNRIVSERLAREREKAAPSEADRKEKDIAAREAALICKEYISTNGYPAALLDVLDTSDADKFKDNVGKLLKLFPAMDPGRKTPYFTNKLNNVHEKDEFAEAFRLNR